MASGTSRRSSRRVVISPVKKPFPWGFALGSVFLVLALGAILVIAFLNTGSGFRTAADRVDETFDGLRVVDSPSATHVPGRVAYEAVDTTPPNSGDHNIIPQTCGVYDAALVPEHAVHSLEHGAVWVTYRPDLPADQVEVLTGLVDGDPYRLLSPYEGLTSPVTLQAWGRSLSVDSATDSQVERFLDEYTDGPQSREKGAPCEGVATPGDEPFAQGPDGTFVPASALVAPPAGQVPAPGQVPVPGQVPAPVEVPAPAPTG